MGWSTILLLGLLCWVVVLTLILLIMCKRKGCSSCCAAQPSQQQQINQTTSTVDPAAFNAGLQAGLKAGMQQQQQQLGLGQGEARAVAQPQEGALVRFSKRWGPRQRPRMREGGENKDLEHSMQNLDNKSVSSVASSQPFVPRKNAKAPNMETGIEESTA